MANARRLIVITTGGVSKGDTGTLGLTMESAVVGSAVPRRTKVTIPFRSGEVDLSRINGSQTYDDRTLTYKFWKRCTSQSEVLAARTDCEAWFLDICKVNYLHDTVFGTKKSTDYPILQFVAACTSVDFSESTNNILRVTVTLTADPYLYSPAGKGVML